MAIMPLENWIDGLPAPVVAALTKASRRVSYQDGQTVHARGDVRSGLSTIVTGSVRVGTTGASGMFHLFGTIGAGGVFGEMTLFTGAGRLHDAYAVGPTVIDQLPIERFDEIADEHPVLLRALLGLISSRLHFAYERMDDAIRRPLIDRVALHLIVLTQGKRGRAELVVGQSELAEAMGASRVSINKTLKSLTNIGMIETGYHRVVIIDRRRLRDWLVARRDVEPVKSPQQMR